MHIRWVYKIEQASLLPLRMPIGNLEFCTAEKVRFFWPQSNEDRAQVALVGLQVCGVIRGSRLGLPTLSRRAFKALAVVSPDRRFRRPVP